MRGGTSKAIMFHARDSRRAAGTGAPIRLEFVEPDGATTTVIDIFR